jgi:hypothetical protein
LYQMSHFVTAFLALNAFRPTGGTIVSIYKKHVKSVHFFPGDVNIKCIDANSKANKVAML